jgi:hypothetical protein
MPRQYPTGFRAALQHYREHIAHEMHPAPLRRRTQQSCGQKCRWGRPMEVPTNSKKARKPRSEVRQIKARRTYSYESPPSL